MRGVILDSGTLGQDVSLTPLMDLLDWEVYEHTPAELALERIRGFPVVLTNKVAITAEMMEQSPQLKYIGVLATGTNNIDTVKARQKGIKVQNVEAYCADSVAQHWLSMVLALAGSLLLYRDDVARGRWSESKIFCRLDYPIRPMRARKLLLIGYGSLGRAVAEIAERALRMEVILAERIGENPRPQRVELDQGLRVADVVSLHCPLTEVTQNMMDERRIGLMKPGAIIINTARGGLIEPRALLKALNSGHLGGAGLDVLPEEPPPKDHPLTQAEGLNLIITPHIAWASREGRANLVAKTAKHLKAFLSFDPQ